ncbi:hypothetical protein J2S59_003629 [Nocardioides massiliensis]|uniref:Uncharacterized protein n=1 Tax=Nocardioides massiliensis TaxID=1325935 RepID=A0ABT9NVH3_9ACTN|nr:hypothetical protein [Nocardioides massiliensis]
MSGTSLLVTAPIDLIPPMITTAIPAASSRPKSSDAPAEPSVLVDLAVLDPEGALDELHAHAEEAGQDHPERRARSADDDRRTDAGDVAQTDRAGQSGGQRLEVGDLPGVRAPGVAPAHQWDRGRPAGELDAPQVDREHDARDHHVDDEQRHLDPEDRRSVEDHRPHGLGERIEGLVDRRLDPAQPSVLCRHACAVPPR